MMKRCLIIGNGPSLNDIPDKFLDMYPTFGSNRVYLRFDPIYYACVNPLVIQQYSYEIAQMQSVKFIRASLSDMVPNSIKLHSISKSVFSYEPLKYIYEGYTVTYVLMQIAYSMNYDEVGLVGVDHRYIFDGRPNQKLIATEKDPNHFDPSYFADGSAWNAPDLVKSEESYYLARAAYEMDGRRIVNLTPGSALDVFDREEWQSWM